MQDAQVLIFKLLSIIIIAVIGYFIASKNILGNNGKTVVSLLLNKVALPLMIFCAYVKIILTPSTIMNALYVMIAALAIYIANYIYSKTMANHYKLSPKERSVFISGGVHANTAFLAFPLLFAVYGDDGLFYATMYYMVDNILLTTSGIGRLMHENKTKRKLAPVTISLIVSLIAMAIINIFNIDFTSTFIFSTVNEIGSMTTPLAFLFVGMIVYESNLKELITNRPATNLIFVKSTLIPLIFIAFFKIVNFDVDGLIIIVVMTQALMPPFSALLSMSYEYNQDVRMATSLVVMGHIYSMINIPLLFSLIVWLFG
ncbi:putative permease [Bacilli bacterium PM5-3]|nr:putative permease [Bacilli bacterium PM5-3]MDH6604108.1 putative permease [Bacilli bacterium PM5-9]